MLRRVVRRFAALAPALLLSGVAAGGATTGSNLVANPGFEQGNAGWNLDARSSVCASAGGRVLRIDARAVVTEAGATCRSVAVVPASLYALGARARALSAGLTAFKVTIEWQDANRRHIAYANDWAGSADGPGWRSHGARCASPPGAAFATLIVGVRAGGLMEFDDLSLVELGPDLRLEGFGSARLIVCPGRPAVLRGRLHNAGGGLAPAAVVSAVWPDGRATVTSPPIGAGGSTPIKIMIKPVRSGAQDVRVTAAAPGTPTASVAVTILVSNVQRTTGPLLRAGSAALRILRAGAVGDLLSLRRGAGRAVAWVAPARAWLEGTPGMAALCGRWRAVGHEFVLDAARDPLRLRVRIRPAGVGWFAGTAELSSIHRVAVREFRFPEIHVEPNGLRTAILPGLEYLDPGEDSSSIQSVEITQADRSAPHPNKVTVPLMAVGSQGAVLGLSWNPLDCWQTGRDRPQPLFSSPNLLTGQDDHLLALCVPDARGSATGDPRWSPPAARLSPGQTIRLRFELFALPGAHAADAVAAYARRYGLPALPEAGCGWEAHWARSVAGRLRMYDPASGGWRAEAHTGYAFHSSIALQLLNYADRHVGPLADRAREQAMAAVSRAVARSGAGTLGADLALRLGEGSAALAGLRTDARSFVATQRPDGTWGFEPGDATRSLGEKGETALGVCAQPTLALLEHVRRTGDTESLSAALRGVRAMDRMFTRPAGGEMWEIPLRAPNLRAAGIAAECGVLAFELTGDRRYLAFARRWALTGLPFVYWWAARNRPQMRFATISVFGATFFTYPWFGRAVQWVGMGYAGAIRRLAPYDRSWPWGRLANGILSSGIGQQAIAADRRFGNPWPGAFPDQYDVVDGVVRPSWIGPQQILSRIEEAVALPGCSTAICRSAERTARVFASADLLSTRWDGRRLRLGIRASHGGATLLVIAGVGHPIAVSMAGRPLTALAGPDAGSGWCYDSGLRAVVVRVDLPCGRPGDLVVECSDGRSGDG